MVTCICHSPLHHQTPDFEGQSVIKASSYPLPFVLEAHRESLPRSCETSARRLSAESAEVYSTADLPASAAHVPFSLRSRLRIWSPETGSVVPSRINLLILHAPAEWCLLTAFLPIFAAASIYLYRHTASGQYRVYRVTQSRTDVVRYRESAGTGPAILKVVPVTGVAFADHHGTE